VAEVFLVTGSLGCIGTWAVRLLVQEGTPVVSLDLGSDMHRPRLIMTDEEMARVRWEKGDITDLGRIEQVLDEHRITNVIHLAALQMPFCKANPPLGAAVNVVGTVNFLEALRRRAERMAPLVYASSMAMFSADDVDPATGRLPLSAVPHPPTHYAVYKIANEGNALLYWKEHQSPSIGLRPMTVFGPGRDQGMTSGGTKAAIAAVFGRSFDIPFGGKTLYNFAEDTARAFIAASRTHITGAPVVNLPGTTADVSEVVAAIETVVPEAKGLITYGGPSLPFPAYFDPDPASPLPALPVTPLEEATRATIALFRAARDAGRLVPAEHGLPD
jgi:nucleoside-diphosphate-sugar epimerase